MSALAILMSKATRFRTFNQWEKNGRGFTATSPGLAKAQHRGLGYDYKPATTTGAVTVPAHMREGKLVRSFQRQQKLNKDDMTPFYGDGIGPKGRIADPRAEIARLNLISGLPGAPTKEGFFNPAVAALLQKGVREKDTFAALAQQMQSRGGKLPPGQLADIAKKRGWTARTKIKRDDLAKEIDQRTPSLATERLTEDRAKWAAHSSKEVQRWQFRRYSETVAHYKVKGGKGDVAYFDDNHFPHRNLEGWLRHKDITHAARGGHPSATGPKRRMIEEVQPQRQEMARKNGTSNPDLVHADIQERFKLRTQIEKAKQDKNSSPDDLNRLLERDAHLKSKIDAADQGVAPSPYAHDVNAATGLLTKIALRSAARGQVKEVSWVPGKLQAQRYGQLKEDVAMLRYGKPAGHPQLDYYTSTGQYRIIGGQTPQDKVAAAIGDDLAKRLLSQPVQKIKAFKGQKDLDKFQILEFNPPRDIGGDGLRRYYGGANEPGIFGAQVQAQLRTLGQRDTSIFARQTPTLVTKGPNLGKVEVNDYPTVKLDSRTREKILRTGLPIYGSMGGAVLYGRSKREEV
jgi:hypothetical protein